MPAHHLRLESSLRASVEAVWAHASTLRGVNDELWPLHMSGPQGLRFDESLALGRPLFRSVLTLLRVLPFDVHSLCLREVDPGHGFHEDSTSLLERRWVHVRTLAPHPGGCLLRDELTFKPRAFSAVTARIVRTVFERRHARLREKFGDSEFA